VSSGHALRSLEVKAEPHFASFRLRQSASQTGLILGIEKKEIAGADQLSAYRSIGSGQSVRAIPSGS
jgi:hypothetical protein